MSTIGYHVPINMIINKLKNEMEEIRRSNSFSKQEKRIMQREAKRLKELLADLKTPRHYGYLNNVVKKVKEWFLESSVLNVEKK